MQIANHQQLIIILNNIYRGIQAFINLTLYGFGKHFVKTGEI